MLQATPANWPNNHESIDAKGWAFILPTVTKEDADKVRLLSRPLACRVAVCSLCPAYRFPTLTRQACFTMTIDGIACPQTCRACYRAQRAMLCIDLRGLQFVNTDLCSM